MEIFKSYLNRYNGSLSDYEPFEHEVQAHCNFFYFTLDFWTRSKAESNNASLIEDTHNNNNNNNNINNVTHEEADPTKPQLVFRIQKDEEDNAYYFEYKRYSILTLNWREPWEIDITMRIEHYDTPRSKVKLSKVTDKLYRALKAAQCPDLINEELANKIKNMNIKKPDLRTFVQNLRSKALIQEMSREEHSVDQDKHKKTITTQSTGMEVAEDVPVRISSPVKSSGTSSTLREYGIADVYSSVDDYFEDDDNNTNVSSAVVSPKKAISSPYKPTTNGSAGSSRPPVNPIVISPDKTNGNAPAPAAARELFTRTPPRPSSPVHKSTPSTPAPTAVISARKTPKQAAKKAPLEKFVLGDKRKKPNSSEAEPSPAAKKRRLTPKQAQRNVEEVEKAQKMARSATFPIILQADGIVISDVLYTLTGVTLKEKEVFIEYEDEHSIYKMDLAYEIIKNLEIDSDEEIRFNAQVEMSDVTKERHFLITGRNFTTIRSILFTKIFDRDEVRD